jgi:multicomponent Na+:H+ antiporter subunit G
MRAWIADVLIVIGLIVVTLGVYGTARLPDVYTKLHASGKAAFLGVSAVLAAAAVGGDPPIVARVVLIIAALTFTTPVAAHVIAQAAHYRQEPMRSARPLEEAGPTSPEPIED